MYTQLKKTRAGLKAAHAQPSEPSGDAVSGGPGIGPGAETDALAGDESRIATAQKWADHHQKLADHFRGSADGGAAAKPDETGADSDSFLEANPPGGEGEESATHEAMESDQVESLEDEYDAPHPAAIEGERVQHQDRAAARTDAVDDAEEETDDGGRPDFGGSLDNTKGKNGYKKPLSKFAQMAKKR